MRKSWVGPWLTVLLLFVVAVMPVLAAQGGDDDGPDDKGDDFFVEIKAPLQAVDCNAGTITVLGLTIDISGAEIENEISGLMGCDSLVVDQTVEVELTGDGMPLTAHEVKVDPDKQGKLEIQGPLQDINTSNQTIQILGQTIDVSGAEFTGFTALSALKLGQIVEADLNEGDLPGLVAEDVELGKGEIFNKLSMKVNFAKPNKDSVVISGNVQLSNSFATAGVAVVVDIGGQTYNFTLDAKGKAKTNEGIFKLSRKNGRWVYTAKLKKGSWSASWTDDGLIDDDMKNVEIQMPVTVTIDGIPFGGTRFMTYNAKSGKSGKAK